MLHDFETGEKNKDASCASGALEIAYDERFGRHILATRDVEPGEIIAMEKPYSLILMLENAYTHCAHCLEVSRASVPCDHCVYAMYCSEECKKKAWENYHDVECKVFGFLVDLNMNNLGFMSMRLAILAIRECGNVEKLKDEVEKVDKFEGTRWKKKILLAVVINVFLLDPRMKGFSENGKFESDKYRSVYSLITNTEKRPLLDLFGRALNSTFILYYLITEGKLLGEKSKVSMLELAENEDDIVIGALILRHQQTIPSNVHSVSFIVFDSNCLLENDFDGFFYSVAVHGRTIQRQVRTRSCLVAIFQPCEPQL